MGAGEVFSETTIRDTWPKPRWEGRIRREVGMAGIRGRGGRTRQTAVLKQQNKT